MNGGGTASSGRDGSARSLRLRSGQALREPQDEREGARRSPTEGGTKCFDKLSTNG